MNKKAYILLLCLSGSAFAYKQQQFCQNLQLHMQNLCKRHPKRLEKASVELPPTT